MGCRKHSPGRPCCNCDAAELTNTIAFDGVEKEPADWIAGSCCPNALWTGLTGTILSQTIVQNNTECSSMSVPQYFCATARLFSMRFWLAKFNCSDDWWVAMAAVIQVGMGVSATNTCATPSSWGSVTLYREKFIPSIATPLTITFTDTDHYDWTAGGACHGIEGNCPTAYTGEIETEVSFCCTTIFDPNCNPLITIPIDFLANDFVFELT